MVPTLISVVLCGVVTMVVAQPDYNRSYTIDQMPLKDRALFLADYLVRHPPLFERLIRIVAAGRDLVPRGDQNPKAQMFQNYLLDVLPFVLAHSETKDIVGILNNELSLVDTSKAEQYIKQKHLAPNSTEAKNVMAGAILKGFNKVRTLQRILTRHSSKEFLPMDENNTISDVCYNDMTNFIDVLPGIQIPPRRNLSFTFVPWAVKMFDAYGKPSGGLTKGSIYWIGSYDLCRSIEARLQPGPFVGNRTLTAPIKFNGKFCRAQFILPQKFIESFGVDTRGVTLSLSWGMCVPDSCHSDDVVQFFDLGVLKGRGLEVKRVTCFEDLDITQDTSAMVASIILIIFAVIVVFSSVVDGLQDWYKHNVKTDDEDDVHVYELKEKSGHINGGYVTDPGEGSSKVIMESSTDDKIEELPPAYMQHQNDKGMTKDYYNGSAVAVRHKENGTAPVTTKPKPTPKKEKDSLCMQLIKAFSMYTNLPKIMSAKKNPSAIHSLHGIRMFSILWIILGHTYNYGVFSEDDNTTTENVVDVSDLSHRFTFQGVMGANMAVDTFFLLSGFLVCFLTLKDLRKRNGKVSVGYFGMFYFHRFWRLTPIYMMIMMSYACLYKYVGGGALWPASIGAAEWCKTNWWTNLLYVNNLVRKDDRCMGWTWYLANDMQFYIVSPIFVMLMYFLPVIGVLLTVLLLLAGMASSFAKEYMYGGDMFSLRENPNYWPEVYIVPWTRVGAYCIGLLLGFLMLKAKKGCLKNWHAAIGWFLSIGVGFTLVYAPYDYRGEDADPWPRWGMGIYESFSRPLWCLCIAWIIFACHHGKGGIIDQILSFSGIIPLSRLTYACYLIHPILQQIYVFSRKTLLYVSDYDIAYLYMAHVIAAYIGALGFSLVFEAPFLTLEKILFRRGSRS